MPITSEQIQDWLAGLPTYGMGDGEYWIPTKESFEELCQLVLQALARPEGSQWQPPADCVAWPVEKQTLVWAECEHNGEKHRTPFWIAPGTLLAGHPNMLRKAGAVQPKPDCSPQKQEGK